MSALFPPWATRAARIVLAGGVTAMVVAPLFAMVWVRTPMARGEDLHIAQPVPFDHRIHVTGLRIDCRYCHAGAERSEWAGLPPTEKCVSCHTQTWISSSVFKPVRQSLTTGRPIPWRRVNELPDFVYFNHSIHVQKGVGCETCHGRIDQMAQVRQVAPLTMGWCLSCHVNPGPNLRPLEAVTAMGWTPPASSSAMMRTLVADYRVERLTNCTTCHR
ncbi:MAG TPA: cytochrome c3 family protein [Gemmatimonadaceae bacterium]